MFIWKAIVDYNVENIIENTELNPEVYINLQVAGYAAQQVENIIACNCLVSVVKVR